ncbi:MAG: hypothetical protein ACXAC7_05930 [Candidatus Hodarchaeales archaeon]|jgi:hypothetical protein
MTQRKITNLIRNLLLFGILSLFVLHFQIPSVSAVPTPSTGPYLASNYEDNTGWFSPERLYVASGPASTADVDGESITLYNFGIIDLGGVTIDGIQVHLSAGSYNTGEKGNLTIVLLYNGRSTSAVENKTLVDLPGSYTDYYLGGATDKWGESSWSPENFTLSNFGIKMVANGPFQQDNVKYVGVEFVQVTVYYTGTISEIQPSMMVIPFLVGVFIILRRRK